MPCLFITLHNIPEGMAVGVTLAGAITENTGITVAGAISPGSRNCNSEFPRRSNNYPRRPCSTAVSKLKPFYYGVISRAEPIVHRITLILWE